MLTAKYKDSDEELDITEHDNPRLSIDKSRLCCKFCNGNVSIKQGLLKAKHFFHLSDCTSELKRHSESIQHNFGKQLIANHVKEFWEEFSIATIKYEYPLPEINRIADIAMIFPNGWIVVHEIQLSPITNEELEKRTNDYQSIGIDTFWWLGKSADKRGNREWSIEKYGYSLSIDYAILDAKSKDLQRGTTS